VEYNEWEMRQILLHQICYKHENTIIVGTGEGKIWGNSRRSPRLIKLKGANGAENEDAGNHQVRKFVGNIKSRTKTESPRVKSVENENSSRSK
jgi:hypothetical protein